MYKILNFKSSNLEKKGTAGKRARDVLSRLVYKDYCREHGLAYFYGDECSICKNNSGHSFYIGALSGFPKRYLGVDWWDFEIIYESHIKAVDNMLRFIKGEGFGFIMLGDVGVGKTMLAAIAALQFSFMGKDVVWLNSYKMLSELRRAEQTYETSAWDLIGEWADYDIIIIDEVGSYVKGEYELMNLTHLINAIYEKDNRVILISNEVDPARVKDMLGDRVIDRFKTGWNGETPVAIIKGKSLRK